MLGTIVNALSIVLGSAIGFFFFKGRLRESTNETIIKGTATHDFSDRA